MKLVGAVLVVMSTTLAGFIAARKYILRPEQLQEFRTALQLLHTEISYGVTPLPHAFGKLKEELTAPIADIFAQAEKNLKAGQPAKQAWEKALENLTEKTALRDKDKIVLKELGYRLGQSARDDQLRHLELAQDKIEKRYEKAVEDREKKVKLWRYLGVLGGLLLVVLII